MFTPGQLVRHQRLRREWTQEVLASATGMSQGAVSKYEGDRLQPSWATLCRLLAVMGMQPRVIAEPCDIAHHRESALARSDLEDRLLDGVPATWRGLDAELVGMLRPNVSEIQPRMYDLVPIVDLLDGWTYAFVGRLALRMHGLGCTVPRVEAVVSAQPGPSAWRQLARRLEDVEVGIWAADQQRYCWRPHESVVAQIASVGSSGDGRHTELSFRTQLTATELRIFISADPLPPHVLRQLGAYEVPLLAVSEFAGTNDPELAAALRRLE